MTIEQIQTQESAAFLSKVRGDVSMRDVLIAAPGRFLGCPIEQVDLPKRLLNRLKNIKVVGDLLRYNDSDLMGQNLGARTLEVASLNLKEFFQRKIEERDYTHVSLREQMQDFAKDLLARESRIWEMRMGLKKERATLEATGEKFSLTRERVRQIENVLFAQFSKRFPAVKMVESVAKEGMTLSDLIRLTNSLIQEDDTLPLVGLLENLSPKYYLIEEFGESLISTTPRSSFETSVRQALHACEEVFRKSEVLISDGEFLQCLRSHGLDDTALQLAASKLTKEGRWLDSKLLSPDDDKTNLAVGILQASPRPMHLKELTDEIFRITKEQTTPETLRSCLSVVPSVRSFGYGTVGFSRHTFLTHTQVKNIISTVEDMIAKGPDGYQWNVKDLLVAVQEKFPALVINHHQLNVILQDSTKLQYLGRLTWSDNTVKERTLYREIFHKILTDAGKPLPIEELMVRANKVRGVHVKGHLAQDVELLEVSPGVWGLTRRDHPFTPKEIKTMLRIFDKSFGDEFNNSILQAAGVNTKGLDSDELIKVLTVHS